jgi:hypothetical protein
LWVAAGGLDGVVGGDGEGQWGGRGGYDGLGYGRQRCCWEDGVTGFKGCGW